LNKHNYIANLLLPIFIGGFSAITYLIGTNLSKPIDEGNVVEFTKFNQILDLIENKYVDSVDRENLFENSISGMLENLDPHSTYIKSEDVESANESLVGHFGGVGIRFIILRDTLMITNVIKGGPSYKAGVKAGDRIIKVNNENIAGVKITNQAILEKLKGPFGSNVKVTTYSPNTNKETEIKLIRDLIALPSLEASFMIKKSSIGYIKLTNFSNTTYKEFKSALANLKSKGMKSLILDLRNNTGGYLDQAIKISDAFLSQNKMIVYTEGVHEPRSNYIAKQKGGFENGKLILLINSYSASASEIVSGAIQDNDRGVIIGRRSFGKGLVQTPISLYDNSELRLTISRYYTPTGRCIQKPYGGKVDYRSEILDRFESGEMQELDSSIFENAKKFVTPKGKTVYGGGGIFPDIYVPLDTLDLTVKVLISSSLKEYCFDYFCNNRQSLNFKTIKDFDNRFYISDQLFNDFLQPINQKKRISLTENEIIKYKSRIKNYLKAEVATYLFDVESIYYINYPFDLDMQTAIKNITHN